MSIGKRIKSLRQNLSITQEELATQIGTTKQNIYKYENEIITNIPSDKIESIAKVLHTSPSYLMGWDNEKEEVESILKEVEKIIENTEWEEAEIAILSKYCSLDDYGKETVDIVLDRELKRCQNMDIKLNAAHELPNATEEGKSRDNDKIYKMLRDKK